MFLKSDYPLMLENCRRMLCEDRQVLMELVHEGPIRDRPFYDEDLASLKQSIMELESSIIEWEQQVNSMENQLA